MTFALTVATRVVRVELEEFVHVRRVHAFCTCISHSHDAPRLAMYARFCTTLGRQEGTEDTNDLKNCVVTSSKSHMK